MQPKRFLTERKVTDLTTLHRTQIARMVKAGAFPAPIYISERRKAWIEDEVGAWMETLASRRPGQG
jgi:prophage regulatory protein